MNPLGCGLRKLLLTCGFVRASVSCHGTDVMDASLPEGKLKRENKRRGKNL